MSDTKPKILWRADREGKCHQWCQQYNPPVGAMSACLLVRNLLPGVTEPDVGGKCPFAVLADVLYAHQQQHEAPVDNLDLEHMMHLVWGCGYCFGRERPNDDHNTVSNRDTTLVDLAVRSVRALNGVLMGQAEITEPATATVLARWNLLGGDDRVLLTFVFEHVQPSRADAIRAALNTQQDQPAEPEKKPEPKPDEDRRCGTCFFGMDYTCNFVRISAKREMRNGSDDGGYLTDKDGPPWPNCKFWRAR